MLIMCHVSTFCNQIKTFFHAIIIILDLQDETGMKKFECFC